MKNLERLISLILIISIVYVSFPQFNKTAYAAAAPINVTFEGYNEETHELTLSWFRYDIHSKTDHVVASYHSDPDFLVLPKTNSPVTITKTSSKVTAVITGDFQNDYIYDVAIDIRDSADLPIGKGFIYFLPRISFYVESVEQKSHEDITNGYYEIGERPALKLSWTVPKVYYYVDANLNKIQDAGEIGRFVPAGTHTGPYTDPDLEVVLKRMTDIREAACEDGKKITGLDYKFGVSSGQSLGDVFVEYKDNGSGVKEYDAYVSGNKNLTSMVKTDDPLQPMYFYLLGIKDKNTSLPADNTQKGSPVFLNLLPDKIIDDNEKNYALPDVDILPGTVLNMNISPVFKDDNGEIDTIAVGADSELIGPTAYAYTPIRFQLSKGSMESSSIILTYIYKINQGNLSLPTLFYDVQMRKSKVAKWESKGKVSDTGGSGLNNGTDFLLSVITDVDPKNEYYYRIVVTDSGGNEIRSSEMLYSMSWQNDKAPIPVKVKADKMIPHAGLGVQPGVTPDINVRSTDVTISWTKPINWDDVASNNDLYFHILLSTNQSDYTWVKSLNVNMLKVKQNDPERLEYFIDGLKLFKGEVMAKDVNGVDVIQEFNISNPNSAPQYLRPNTVYYMQICATRGITDFSSAVQNDIVSIRDKSVPVSFTTLPGNEREVPLVNNFKLLKPYQNKVELQFDTVNINWSDYTLTHDADKDKCYYDLYMSTNDVVDPDQVPYASTETPTQDVLFDEKTGFTVITIDALKANTTYYFKLKTRLYIDNNGDSIQKTSAFTAILPATTIRGDIQTPDDDNRKPLAPIDFGIAKDSKGDPVLTGTSVDLSWKRMEDDVTYTMIATSYKIAPDASDDSYKMDATYLAFINAFGQNISLDPSKGNTDTFTYVVKSKMLTYTIGKWLTPNTLYYFSLRAVRKKLNGSLDDPEIESAWISIPVTTALIEAPTSMEAIIDAQLGFYWSGKLEYPKADDYKIWIKGPEDDDYKMQKSLVSVVKDGTNTYYGRVRGLKINTAYDIKVYAGSIDLSPVTEFTGMNTRDGFHEIEVKWQGEPGNDYELAVRTEDDADYTTLDDSDLEGYLDTEGKELPYYTEKTAQLSATSYYYYFARIKSVKVTLPNGTTENKPLKANTKYYIKVRAVKHVPVVNTNDVIDKQSKYIGPVNTRTEFSQEDYNDDEKDKDKAATFLNKMEELESGYYWRIDITSGPENKILLRGDKIINALQNSTSEGFSVDVSGISASSTTDIIYIPAGIIRLLISDEKSLSIKTAGGEYTIRPETLILQNINEIKQIQSDSATRDLFIKLTVSRSDNPVKALPTGAKLVSKVNTVRVQGLGSVKTDSELKDLIHDKIYNADTGLLKEKMGELLTPGQLDSNSSSSDVESYIKDLVDQVESELSNYIDDTIADMIKNTKDIKTFTSPLGVKLAYSGAVGLKLPHAYYDGTLAWQKITQNIADLSTALAFSVPSTGKYAVLLLKTGTEDISDPALKSTIDSFLSKYDLNGILDTTGGFYPGSSVSVKEIILLYEKVLGKTDEDAGLDIKQKLARLGLDGVVSSGNVVRDVQRQEAATILMKLYCAKLGLNIDSMKTKKNIFIKDDQQIGSKYLRPVLLAVDMGIFTLDGGGFAPQTNMTREQIVEAFVKLLKLTGDM